MLVPAEMLTKAGGWGNLVNSMSNMLGPVIGAAMMSFLSIASIMLVDIFGAAFAVFCLLFIKLPDVPRKEGKPQLLGDMKEGLKALNNNKPLRAVFFPMMLVNVVYMPLGSLFPLLVRTHFQGTAWHNSIVELVFAAGLLVSSLIMGVWGGLKRRFLMISLAVLLLGVVATLGGLLPGNAFVAFAGLTFFMGSAGTFINVPLMAYTQNTIAPEQLGKVFSFLLTAMSLAMPVGLLVAGPVSEWIGVNRWFFYSGVAMLLVGILCWAVTAKYDRQQETV